VNWRLQITDGGETAEPVVFSHDSAYDDAVVFIGVTMILAAARCRKFSVDIELDARGDRARDPGMGRRSRGRAAEGR
jgi:hypothetical protein